MTTTEHKLIKASPFNKETWQEKKSKLKEKFPHLTDPDLDIEEGKVEEMLEKLHSKIGTTIGKTKEGLHKFIDAL